jgi:hypothetical protein
MSVLDWVLSSILLVIYLMCLVTACMLTFKRGIWCWAYWASSSLCASLIGAILPPRRGSRYEVEESLRLQRPIQPMTS